MGLRRCLRSCVSCNVIPTSLEDPPSRYDRHRPGSPSPWACQSAAQTAPCNKVAWHGSTKWKWPRQQNQHPSNLTVCSRRSHTAPSRKELLFSRVALMQWVIMLGGYLDNNLTLSCFNRATESRSTAWVVQSVIANSCCAVSPS